MGFYEQIAPYYDLIFPAGREQLEFIKKAAGGPPKKLLDVACGAGTYAVELAREGYEVWATDLDEEMIRQTEIRAAAGKVAVKAEALDMLKLNELSADQFDCLFCIGNSIVHLGSKDAILDALRKMKGKLCENGSLLLQIINFDRILSKGITSLPSILNPEAGMEFHRNYSYDAPTGLIHFNTVLRVSRGKEWDQYSNSIKLFPLISSDLQDLLERAGFGTIDCYGGFRYEPYDPGESYLLVIRAAI